MSTDTQMKVSQRDADGKIDPRVANLTDAELIAQARRGVGAAVEALWLRNVNMAMYHAWRWCGIQKPEDIVTEAFARILKLWREGQGPDSNFRGYLMTTITNMARKEGGRSNPVLVDDWSSYSQESVDEYARIDQQEAVASVFYAMNQRYRRVLWSREVEGLSIEEIAAGENMSVANVSIVLHRARHQFKKLWMNNEALEAAQAAATVAVPQKEEKEKERKPSARGIRLAAGVFGAGVAVAYAVSAPAAQAAVTPASLPPVIVAQGDWKSHGSSRSATQTVLAVVIVIVLVAGILAAVFWPRGGAGAASVTTSDPTSISPSSTEPVPPVTTPSAPVTEPVPPVEPSETPTAQPSSADSYGPASTEPVPPVVVASPISPVVAEGPGPKDQPAIPALPVPPLTITGVDAGPGGVCYPSLSGKGLPGTTINVGLPGGSSVSAQVDASGNWQSARLGSWLAAGTRDVTAWDPTGAQTQALAQVNLPTPPNLGASGTTEGVRIVLSGLPGQSVEVTLDGKALGDVTLDSSGRADQVLPWTGDTGTYSIAVRYHTSVCDGPAASMSLHL